MDCSIDVKLCTTKNLDLFAHIMKLRYEAYRADNRLTWQSTWTDMRDQWDDRSIIAVAYVNGQISGSVRVTVNNYADELSYPSLIVKSNAANCTQLTTNILPDQYVESSRLCISPYCRGKGLWYPLAAHMIVIANKTGRRYIVGSAINELIPTWTRIGFNKTGYRYFNDDIGGQVHEMMILDIPQVLEGHCDKIFYQTVLAALNAPYYEDLDIQTILLRPWQPNITNLKKAHTGSQTNV